MHFLPLQLLSFLADLLLQMWKVILHLQSFLLRIPSILVTGKKYFQKVAAAAMALQAKDLLARIYATRTGFMGIITTIFFM